MIPCWSGYWTCPLPGSKVQQHYRRRFVLRDVLNPCGPQNVFMPLVKVDGRASLPVDDMSRGTGAMIAGTLKTPLCIDPSEQHLPPPCSSLYFTSNHARCCYRKIVITSLVTRAFICPVVRTVVPPLLGHRIHVVVGALA